MNISEFTVVGDSVLKTPKFKGLMCAIAGLSLCAYEKQVFCVFFYEAPHALLL